MHFVREFIEKYREVGCSRLHNSAAFQRSIISENEKPESSPVIKKLIRGLKVVYTAPITVRISKTIIKNVTVYKIPSF
jgi:hypothetical protein